MRVYISADIEGIHGVAARCHLRPGGHEYEEARMWMTLEVKAAATAALESGAAEVVIADSHGNALNVIPSELPSGTRLVRSWPRPLGMMQGIESGNFSSAFLIGFHASATSHDGVLAHTLDGTVLADLRVSGESISEARLCAAIAGHFGVPISMVSGDRACLEEARQITVNCEFYETKISTGFASTQTLVTEEAISGIAGAASRALARQGSHQCYTIQGPLEVECEFRSALFAEAAAMLPTFRRTDYRTVSFSASNIVDVNQFVTAALYTASGAAGSN